MVCALRGNIRIPEKYISRCRYIPIFKTFLSNLKKIITEDSNSGYDFFEAVSREKRICCESAGGKSNIFSSPKDVGNEEICVVADGAAIGPEMNRLYKQCEKYQNIKLYLPELFEWIILKSGLIEGKKLKEILEKP